MLGWLIDWAMVVVSAALVGEAFVSKRGLISYPAHIGARAAVIAAALLLSIPLEFTAEMWWRGVQRARREYDRRFAATFIRFGTAVTLLMAAIYSALVIWLLRWMWRSLARLAATIDPLHIVERPKVGASWVVGLLAATALLAWWAARSLYPTVRNYRVCIRELGLGHTLRGVAMMVLLRLRQPRRSFFRMTPVIADMLPFALCAGLYEVVPIASFAAPMAFLAASIVIAMSLDRIRPPTWLFLGTSDYEAFWVFDDLRHNWGVTALCLLDRGSEKGYMFYQAEREMWARERRMPVGIFYDPSQPRVWNVRTRPDMWEHTVLLLIDYVPRIVVDLRQPSEFVLEEVKWLSEPSRIEKTLFLFDEETGLLPEYAAVIPEPARGRVLTGPALYSYYSESAAAL